MPNPVEVDLQAALAADATIISLCAGRIRPVMLEQGIAYPAIVYQRISTVREKGTSYTLDKGYGGFAWARFQIEAWAKKYSDAVALAAAIRGVVHALDLVGSPANMILQELDGIETSRVRFRCTGARSTPRSGFGSPRRWRS